MKCSILVETCPRSGSVLLCPLCEKANPRREILDCHNDVWNTSPRVVVAWHEAALAAVLFCIERVNQLPCEGDYFPRVGFVLKYLLELTSPR
jgi:hypothetical protein